MGRGSEPVALRRDDKLGHALGLSGLLALAAVIMDIAAHQPLAALPALLGPGLQWLVLQLAAALLVTTPVAAAVLYQHRMVRRLRESEARYRLLADQSSDIIMTTDPAGAIRFVSPSITGLTGQDPAALAGQPAMRLAAPQDVPLIATAYRAAMARPGCVEAIEFRAPRVDSDGRCGGEAWFEATLRAVAGPGGAIDCVVSIIRDISARKAMEEALSQAALTDPLTGLANRRHFERELARTIAAGQTGCVALVDLDHFKLVNDRFGHAAGDAVLKTFARVARAELRASDLIARIGGEEFALLLPGASLDVAEMVCGRLGATLSRTTTAHGNARIVITTSIGLAPLGGNAESTMAQADRALYEAKATGRDRLSVAA